MLEKIINNFFFKQISDIKYTFKEERIHVDYSSVLKKHKF